MNYEESLNYLFSQLPMFQRIGKAAYKANLGNSYKLDKYLGFPHKKYPTIHIAGTNGKGSVAHILSSVLQDAGYKVGLHTSPHLLDFRERIKVNGKLAEKTFVLDFIERYKKFFEKLKPSFFEISVFMAFEYFAQKKVDISIIEVGLGGRLDSTNVINPVLSIITNIGLDHTEFLGDTHEKIAFEKGGIIKENTPVVIGESQTQTNNIFKEIARRKNSEISFADTEFSITKYNWNSLKEINIDVVHNSTGDMLNIICNLPGSFQQQNIVTTLQSIYILKDKSFSIKEKNILTGFKNVSKNTGYRGRFEYSESKPDVICDNGHNYEALVKTIGDITNLNYEQKYFIIGFVQDKKVDKILKLLPDDIILYITKPNIPRAMNEHEANQYAVAVGKKGKTFSTVHEAYKAVNEIATKNDLIFIGGSTFVVADYLKMKT